MKLAMVGCSHHRTPVEIRERLAFMPPQVEEALRGLRTTYGRAEFALLSTCNRVELYTAASDPADIPQLDRLREYVLQYHRLPAEPYQTHLAGCEDALAIEHLFTVAGSLDSLVVGEAQIISQVKDAYESARHASTAGPILHAAFQRASHVAKRVTNETEVHAKRVSIPSVAISEVAREFFERFDDKRILVIGTGEMGRETIKYLYDAGATEVRVVNRSIERARQLVDRVALEVTGPLQLTIVEWGMLHQELAAADLVVSTTAATDPIVTAAEFKQLQQNRRRRGPQLILDLAVPRDFDTEIDRLQSVYVYSIDDLQAVCERNLSHRQQQFPAAKAIIAEETAKFMAETRFWHAGPTIRALRQYGDEIKAAELQRLNNRLQQLDVPPAVRDEVSGAIDRVVNKLLNAPLQSLRNESEAGDAQELLVALRRLFRLDGDGHAGNGSGG